MNSMKRITGPAARDALFSDHNHNVLYERLEKSWSDGGRDGLKFELEQQLSVDCPIPVLMFLQNKPRAFNLTLLRRCQKLLAESGYSEPAREVLSTIAKRSGKVSDQLAAERAQATRNSSSKPLDLGLMKARAFQPRQGMLLLVGYQSAFESWPRTFIRASELLTAGGYGVAVALIGRSDSRLPKWSGKTPFYRISEAPFSKPQVKRLHNLAEGIHARAREIRASAVIGAVNAEHAIACGQAARSLNLPFLWDYRVDELWRWTASNRRNDCLCGTQLSDSFLPVAQAEKQAIELSNVTWFRSKASQARLSELGFKDLEMSPFNTLNRGLRRFITDVYVDASGLPVTKVVELIKPLVSSAHTETLERRIWLVGPLSDDFRERVGRGIRLKGRVGYLERWTDGLENGGNPHDSLAILPKMPGLKDAEAYAERLQDLQEAGFLVATPTTEAEILLADDFRNTIRFPAGDGRAIRRQIDAVEYPEGALSSSGIKSRAESREARSSYRQEPQVSSQEAGLWGGWMFENPSSEPGGWFNAAFQTADDVINRGWRFAEFPPIYVSPDSDWEVLASGDRSHGFHFHTWKFMDAVIQEFLKTGESRYLAWCADIAQSWAVQMTYSSTQSMAWYDMSLALRSPRLVGLIQLLVNEGGFDEQVRTLFDLALAHQDAHTAEESFNPRNNHGFYAALGQVVLGGGLAVLPGMAALKRQGDERLRTMVEQQFKSDGGHAEHSPDYHRMLLNTFQYAINRGIIDQPFIIERIERAARALGWLVQPDGTLLQFGDSPATNMHRGQPRSTSETTEFILSDGRHGVPDSVEIFTLPETGYAIVRSPQPKAEGDLKSSSYLAFMAAFHSRAHKHCDDLSMVWTHRGSEILVDGGRYGYGDLLPKDSPLRSEGFYYDSPERQFVESSKAHNVVVLNGKNHDRRREPYGSGLVDARGGAGVFQIVGKAKHRHWTHTRTLDFKEGESLVVTDVLDAKDEDEHEFTIYFNLAGDLDLRDQGEGFSHFQVSEGSSIRMSWDDCGSRVDLHRGVEGTLLGWRSRVDRELIPTWSHARTGSFRSSRSLRTVFHVH